MTKEDLLPIIEKYQRLSEKYYPKEEEKSHAYDRFAEFLEDYNEDLVEDETEKSLWEHFLEVEEENWEMMFPEGNDKDNSITDWMTND